MQFRFSPGGEPGSSGLAVAEPLVSRNGVDGGGVMDPAELRALGAAVREVRARRGLSQEELGFAGGLHRNYVGGIERGELNITFRITRVHLTPFFGERTLDAIEPEDVIDLVALLERKGRAPATVRGVIATLSALFVFAKAPYRRWAVVNPCEGVDLPALPDRNEIRNLTLPQIDWLIANVRPGEFAHLDRAIFITAVMTGLRKGDWSRCAGATSTRRLWRNDWRKC